MRKNYNETIENGNAVINEVREMVKPYQESVNVDCNVDGSFNGSCNIEGNVDVKVNINIDLDGASIAEVLKAMAISSQTGNIQENLQGFLEGALNKEVSAINNGFSRLVDSINNKFNHKSEDK